MKYVLNIGQFVLSPPSSLPHSLSDPSGGKNNEGDKEQQYPSQFSSQQHNHKRERPAIEFWPESHLESLLAERPPLVTEFGLRPHG